MDSHTHTQTDRQTHHWRTKEEREQKLLKVARGNGFFLGSSSSSGGGGSLLAALLSPSVA